MNQPFTPVAFRSGTGFSYDDALYCLHNQISGAKEHRGHDIQILEVIRLLEELHLKWRLDEDLIAKAIQARAEREP